METITWAEFVERSDAVREFAELGGDITSEDLESDQKREADKLDATGIAYECCDLNSRKEGLPDINTLRRGTMLYVPSEGRALISYDGKDCGCWFGESREEVMIDFKIDQENKYYEKLEQKFGEIYLPDAD